MERVGRSLERGWPAVRGHERTLVGGLGGCCHFMNPQPKEHFCCQRVWEGWDRVPASRSPRGPASSLAAVVAEAAEPRPLQSPPSPSLAFKEQRRLARSWRTRAQNGKESAAGRLKRQHAPSGTSLCAQGLRLQSQFAIVSRPPKELAGHSPSRPRRCHDGAPAQEDARLPPSPASALALCAARGKEPSIPAPAVLPAPALQRPRSAARELCAPGREGPAAGSSGGAA